MKRRTFAALTMALLLSSLLPGGVAPGSADQSKLLQFNTMIGVPRPYTGMTNAIRGVPGGGLPWVIAFGMGTVTPDGGVNVLVKGLVLNPDDPEVIARGIGGTNPIPNFKAVVSCLSREDDDDGGSPIIVNVETGLFPADAAGNAHIKDIVLLPQPCIAPILFVTSPTGAWFASTGF